MDIGLWTNHSAEGDSHTSRRRQVQLHNTRAGAYGFPTDRAIDSGTDMLKQPSGRLKHRRLQGHPDRAMVRSLDVSMDPDWFQRQRHRSQQRGIHTVASQRRCPYRLYAIEGHSRRKLSSSAFPVARSHHLGFFSIIYS